MCPTCPGVLGGGQQLPQLGVLEVLHPAEVQQLQAGAGGLAQGRDHRPGAARHVQLQQPWGEEGRGQPAGQWQCGGASEVSPCSRLMSHISCFLEMLVQPRLRETGWRRTTPLSMGGVTERWRLRSIQVHSRLSQHLGVGVGGDSGYKLSSRAGEGPPWSGPAQSRPALPPDHGGGL